MATTTPLWLQISLASVPVLAAIVAGTFALKNTLNRRVERLKNLTEIHSKLPKDINPHNALEVIILYELKAIEFAVMPKHKWNKRVHYIWMACTLVGYCIVVISLFRDIPTFLSIGGSVLMGVGATTLLIGVVWLNVHVQPWRAHNVYDSKIRELRGTLARN